MSSAGEKSLGRLDFKDLFLEKGIRDRKIRNEGVGKAVGEWRYTHREGADYLSLDYSTLSRLMKEREKSTNDSAAKPPRFWDQRVEGEGLIMPSSVLGG